MTNQNSVKVAIVDDNKDIVNSLKSFLAYTNKLEIVCTALSGEELIKKIAELGDRMLPEVVITDILMTGMSGVELVRRMKAVYPDMKFLMLTVNDDEQTLFDAIQAGADGYLMKDEKVSAIADMTISMVREGDIPMTSRIARKILNLLSRHPVPERRTIDLEKYGLSQREQEVLQMLVNGKDYRAIAGELNISPHTVRKHISNIYGKLHISSKAQAINLFHASEGKTTSSGNGLRTIIVDDHKIILDSLSMMLSTIPGLQIKNTFSDSREVIPWLKQHKVDLLISDVSMPVLNGIDLARSIKSDYPDVKIMMLTVSDDMDQINKAKELGIDGYLLKKASRTELQKAIESISDGGKYYFCDVPALA